MIHLQHTPITDAAVVCSGWLGINALLTDGDSSNVIPALGWVSRRSGDGLVVMEDDEDQIPVTIEEMPAEPWYRVGSEDEGQDTQISNGHDGPGQHDHQHHKHHSKPADHIVHQPVDRLKGSINGSVTASKGIVEQGAQANLAITPALYQAPEQRWASTPVAQEQKEAQAEAGWPQQQTSLASHGSWLVEVFNKYLLNE